MRKKDTKEGIRGKNYENNNTEKKRRIREARKKIVTNKLKK